MKKYINWKLIKASPKAMIILFAVVFFAFVGLRRFLLAIWNLIF